MLTEVLFEVLCEVLLEVLLEVPRVFVRDHEGRSPLADVEPALCGRQAVMVLLFDVLLLQLQEKAFCLLYTSPSPRDGLLSRMPSSA